MDESQNKSAATVTQIIYNIYNAKKNVSLKFPRVLFTKSNMICNDSRVWSQQSQSNPSSLLYVLNFILR